MLQVMWFELTLTSSTCDLINTVNMLTYKNMKGTRLVLPVQKHKTGTSALNYQSNLALCTQGLNVTHGFWGSLCDSSNTSSEMNDLPGFCQTIWSKSVSEDWVKLSGYCLELRDLKFSNVNLECHGEKDTVLDFLSQKGATASFEEEGNPCKEASSGQRGGGKHFPAGQDCLAWSMPQDGCPPPGHAPYPHQVLAGISHPSRYSRHIPAVNCFDLGRYSWRVHPQQ